jgi:hypothetical protein
MDKPKVKRVRKVKSEPVIVAEPEPVVEEPVVEEVDVKVRKGNKWIEHVKAYRSMHPELSYTEAMRASKVSYVK